MKQTPLRMVLISTSILFGLNGCSMLKEMLVPKPIDYASARQIPALDIPPDLTKPTTDTHFQVADSTAQTGTTYSAYSAEQNSQNSSTNCTAANGAGSTADTIKLKRAGSERWLVVNQPGDKLWPQLKTFWQDNGFVISQSDPATGIMETAWTGNNAKAAQDTIHNATDKQLDSLYASSERDKYRTRLEPSASDPNQTEIYISHRGMREVPDCSSGHHPEWQPSPPNPELEAGMLSRLMVSLGVTQARADAMLAAQNNVEQAKINQSSDGSTLLTDNESFDGAWQRVGLALDRNNFVVMNRDRTKGIYYIRFLNQKSGFFSKLLFWRNANSQYQISLAENPGATHTDIRVLDAKGKPAKPEITHQIINSLFAQLK